MENTKQMIIKTLIFKLPSNIYLAMLPSKYSKKPVSVEKLLFCGKNSIKIRLLGGCLT